MSHMTSLVTTARRSDDDGVKLARLATACVAVTTALSGCTTGHRLAPVAQQPAAQITLSPGSAVKCPAYATLGANGQPAVPLAPIAAQRLAPLQVPSQLVVCRYRGNNVLQLTGSRQVRVGLATAGTELAWSPRAMGGPTTCTAIAGRHTPYLIGLRYPSGVLWVTTAYDVNGCEVTSNGSFTTATYVGNDVDHAFSTGVWVGGIGRDTSTDCLAWPTGRLGQDQHLVPPDPTALTICSANGAPSAHRAVAHVTRSFSSLVRTLDGVATRPSGHMCDPHGDEVVAYELRFDYSQGPAVVVDVAKNCDPRISNDSLDADSTAQIWAMVDDLAHHPSQT